MKKYVSLSNGVVAEINYYQRLKDEMVKDFSNEEMSNKVLGEEYFYVETTGVTFLNSSYRKSAMSLLWWQLNEVIGAVNSITPEPMTANDYYS